MSKVIIRPQKAVKAELSPVAAPLLAAGAGGLCLLLSDAGIPLSFWALAAVCAVCAGGFLAASRFGGKGFARFAGGVALVGALLALFRADELSEQTARVVSMIQGGGSAGMCRELSVLFGAAVSLLLVFAECVARHHLIPFLLTCALMLACPYAGIQPGALTVLCLALFQWGMWGARLPLPRRAGGAPLRSGGAVALSLLVCFALALYPASRLAEPLGDAVQQTRQGISTAIQKRTQGSEAMVMDGIIARDNLVHSGSLQAHLFAFAQSPAEPLYLSVFKGGQYDGKQWLRHNDTDLFLEAAKRIEAIPFDLAYRLQDVADGNQKWDEIYSILNLAYPLRASQPIQITVSPVFRVAGRWDTYNSISGFLKSQATESEYTICYYPPSAMGIDWEQILSATAAEAWEGEDISAFRETLDSLMRERYTQVPRELLPRLTRLVEQHPLTSLDEITAYILYTLCSNTSYTVAPGIFPANRDPAETFLFERQKGYCDHYAHTATLLYRLYGIPARYVSGYLISSGSEAGPAGITPSSGSYEPARPLTVWQSAVTDENAHAWCEIFLPDYGWTPVEVTPSADGRPVTAYPGFDAQRMREIWDEHGWDLSVPSLLSFDESQDTRATFFTRAAAFLRENAAWLLPLAVFAAAAAVFAVLAARRAIRHRRWRAAGCRAQFDRLLAMLNVTGTLEGMSGEEPDFAGRLSEAVPAVAREDAEEMVDIVQRAAFSDTPPSAAENRFVRGLVHRCAGAVERSLSPIRRWAFRYLYGFDA